MSEGGPALLAVDAGLRTGLAAFSRDGRLRWYRSQNFGNRQRLKRAAFHLLRGEAGLTNLIVEGGGDLGRIWFDRAVRIGLSAELVSAETWRQDLLLDRDQRGAARAKERADELARDVITQAGAREPTSLRHDAAEAILIGFWQVKRLGWLSPDIG